MLFSLLLVSFSPPAVPARCSRPTMKRYCDVTQTKQNTLTEQSQEIIGRLEGCLTIHTFVNILEPNYWMATPRSQKND